MSRPEPEADGRGSDRREALVRFIAVCVFLVPVSIGALFGYVAWTHGKLLDRQFRVDRDGVAITAEVSKARREIVRHQSTRLGDGETRASSTSEWCRMAVTYVPRGRAAPLLKEFRLDDASLCQRYKAGDKIGAKYVPSAPHLMLLDESRLDATWYWLSIALSALFAGGPILLLLRSLLLGRRKG
ncbi:MAG TPA: hypothetical protein VMX97_12240 [Hyphomicrobiaceae bacterium]|nr:hypothetical protein [Hyphomicrobiaceae bacterium]